jgi:hypothetical protein
VAEQDGHRLIRLLERRVGSQVDEFEAVEAAAADPAESGLHLVELAPGAKAGR